MNDVEKLTEGQGQIRKRASENRKMKLKNFRNIKIINTCNHLIHGKINIKKGKKIPCYSLTPNILKTHSAMGPTTTSFIQSTYPTFHSLHLLLGPTTDSSDGPDSPSLLRRPHSFSCSRVFESRSTIQTREKEREFLILSF